MPKKTEGQTYLNFVCSMEFLKRIDDFRFAHRFHTRAAAVKWLLRFALGKGPVPSPEEVREKEE